MLPYRLLRTMSVLNTGVGLLTILLRLFSILQVFKNEHFPKWNTLGDISKISGGFFGGEGPKVTQLLLW